MSTDTRQLLPESLFVALKGERYDGHEFVAEAARRGASAVLGERTRLPAPLPDCAVVAVPNSRRALGEWAAWHRRRFDPRVVAVAGSNGKTTVKQLLAAVLAQRFATLASEASFNNDIGVPLTLLKLDRACEAAVLEVGTNHPGELAPLLRMIAPRVGVLTSLGPEHLEHFGDLDGVIQEEGWLAELLPAEGLLVMPGDDPATERVGSRTPARRVRVGWQAGNDWRVTAACVDESGTSLQVEAPRPEWSGEYWLALLGRHQAVNALLALAVGAELGLTAAELRRGLAACPQPPMRLALSDLHGVRVLDDSYNANVASMQVALETLRDLADGGRTVAILGDMAELGARGPAAHAEVARLAAATGVGHLFAVGRMAGVLAETARQAGLADAREFADSALAGRAAKEFLRPGDWVLVKASRAARLERVVEILKHEA